MCSAAPAVGAPGGGPRCLLHKLWAEAGVPVGLLTCQLSSARRASPSRTMTHTEQRRVTLYRRESLEKLGLQYLDLYLVHWPVTGNKGDTLQPTLEVGR